MSRAVDLIQSEYGTPHEVALDLPICTLRQKVATIELRHKEQRIYQQTITEWQTRTLAQFIVAASPLGKAAKPLANEAARIRLRMEDTEKKSESDAPPEVFIEQGSQVAHNSAGSYEKLMGAFGG